MVLTVHNSLAKVLDPPSFRQWTRYTPLIETQLCAREWNDG